MQYKTICCVVLGTSLFNLSLSAYGTKLLSLNKGMPPGLLSFAELHSVATHRDVQGTKHVRMQQYYKGYLVVGGYVIAHYPTNKAWMSGSIYQDLQTELGDPPKSFISNQSKALLQAKTKFAGELIVKDEVTPLVFVDEEKIAHWAYQVRLWVEPKHAIPKQPVIILDAQSFHELLSWDEVKTMRLPVNGQGYGGNAGTGLIQYGRDRTLLSLLRDPVVGKCYLDNNRVTVLDMEGGYGPQSIPVSFECSTVEAVYWTGKALDGYDKINDAYSPSNDALYVGTVVRDLYVDWYGVEPLEHALAIKPLIMRVHYGEGYENAFWDGKQMTFGDGGHSFYPLVSLSIGAHEVSHGFTERHSNLAYVGQSGGMNESFSDMAAQVAQFYVDGSNNWLIGSEILKDTGRGLALRYMDRPSLDGRSIERADEFRRDMDVHYSSGVYNRFFYLFSNKPGFNTRSAFGVVLKANMDYWVPHSTFKDGACGVVWAAMDLNLPIEPIVDAFNEVAIDTSSC